MKKSDELKQERYSLMTQLRELPNSGLEQRKMEEKETELDEQIHKISGEILDAETKEKRKLENMIKNGRLIRNNDLRDLANYSFTRAIRIAAGIEKPDGLEEEMNQEARRETNNLGMTQKGFGIPSIVLNHRASTGQNYTTDADGGYLSGTGGQMMFFDALRNKLTLTRLGARFLTGLHGNLPIVGGGSFTAAWAAEGGEISKTKSTFADRGTLTPKRLGSLGAISKELIHQSSPDVEQMIINQLTDSIVQAIEDAAIDGSGTGATPTGILNYAGIGAVVGGENGAALDWDDVVELESKVKEANAHGANMGYLTNSKVIKKLKTTLKTSAERFIMEDNSVNGYSCLDTNAVPSDLDKGTSTGVCSAMIFGAWENLLIGQWGGLDLIVDPYTRKAFGEIELNTTQFCDLGLSNPSHFAVMKDILTT